MGYGCSSIACYVGHGEECRSRLQLLSADIQLSHSGLGKHSHPPLVAAAHTPSHTHSHTQLPSVADANMQAKQRKGLASEPTPNLSPLRTTAAV
jgi:hypothetical protein